MQHYWKKYASSPDASTVNKEEATNIVRDSVNYLGSLGSGVTFDDTQFESVYNTVDMLGVQKNPETGVTIMVTSMVSGKTA